jgi:hypothetical protein
MTLARIVVLASLVAVFVASLAGCSRRESAPAVAPAGKTQPPAVLPAPPKPPPSFFRDHYARLEDCVYDWGYAQKCVPVPPGTPAHQAGANFFGPTYARTYREETQVQLRREAITGGYAQNVASDASDKSIAKSEVKP